VHCKEKDYQQTQWIYYYRIEAQKFHYLVTTNVAERSQFQVWNAPQIHVLSIHTNLDQLLLGDGLTKIKCAVDQQVTRTRNLLTTFQNDRVNVIFNIGRLRGPKFVKVGRHPVTLPLIITTQGKSNKLLDVGLMV
jgi:hypothetical protein